ncbi:MAG: hypothetical protein L6R38_009121 [Xanthoria sp. 2 TBL-2021]|nr:MAG: hypothetical protein L6R38_009121 [Xanthoria sp. 2 TBL-2021]
MSEPCLAYRRGHCLFVVRSQVLENLQAARKAALGQTNILARLLKAFLDRGRNPRARRWIGFLVLELLRGCRENKETLSRDLAQASRGLGEAIIHGSDEILKLIAGSIIREMVDNGSSASDFFQPDLGTIASVKFPEIGEQASQWTTDFILFVDHLDTQGFLTQERGALTFAYAVYMNGISYTTATGLSILVTVSDELTIVVPSTQGDTTKCIDIPLRNILTAEVELGGPGSQPRLSQASKAAVLVLHLSEHAGAAYYINESERPPCRINLAFDTVGDANATKDRIETIAAHNDLSVQRTEQNETIASSTPEQNYPVELLSQSVLLDISNNPTHQNDAFGGLSPLEPQAPRATHLTDAAAQANELPANSTNLLSLNEVVLSYKQNERAKHPADLAARSHVMTGAGSINVSQDIADDSDSAQGKHSPGSPLAARRRSSSVWRDGLITIENAAELQPNLTNKDDNNTADAPHVSNDNDDDLYTATPRAPKTHPKAGSDGGGSPKPAVKRKLSQSMQVGEGERLSALPSTGRLPGLNQGTGSCAKQSSSTASHNKGTKRKTIEKQANVPNKKTKLGGLAAKRTIQNSKAPDSAEDTTENNIFDLPETPPDRQKAMMKSQKPGESKFKASKSTRSDPAAKATKKPLKAHSGVATAASRSKPISKQAKKKLGTGEVRDDEDAQIPVGEGNDSVSIEQQIADTKPVIKRPRKAKLQTTSKEKTALSSSTPKVKKESRTKKPKSSVPTRTSQGKRAAAQKAKQQIHDQASDAYEDGSPFHEPQSIGDDGVSGKRVAAGPVSENHSAAADDAGRDVLASAAKETLATKGDVDDDVPLVVQSATLDVPKSATDDFQHQSQLAVEGSVTKPSGVLSEHEEFHVPVVPDAPPVPAADVLERVAAKAIIEKGDSANNNDTVDNRNFIFPDDKSLLRDELQHEMTSPDNVTAYLLESEEGVGKADHLVEACDIFDTVDRPGEVLSMAQGPNIDVESTFMKQDQAIALNNTKIADSPQVVSTAHRKIVGGIGHVDQKEMPDAEKLSAHRRSPSQDHESSVSGQRTSPTHLASNLCSTMSGLLNIDEPMRQSTNIAQLIHQTRTQLSSDRKDVKFAARSTETAPPAPRGGEHTKKETNARNFEASLITSTTKESQREVPQTPGFAADASIRKRKLITKPDIEPLTNAEPDTYTISSGPSSEPRSEDESHDVSSTAKLHPSKTILTDPVQGDGNQSSTTPISLPAQPLSPSDKTSKKRSLKIDDRDASKKVKLHSPKGLKHAPDSSRMGVGVYKDPNRIPQLISFGPKGPRNQGLSSPKHSTRHEKLAGDIQSKAPTQDQGQKRKRDVEVDVKREWLQSKNVQPEKSTPALKAAIKTLPQQVRKLPGPRGQHSQVEGRQPLAVQQPRGRARGLLPAHSSILGDDSAQHISSQGSRVDENGSPLPTQRSRTHTFRGPAVERKYLDKDKSDSENVVPSLIEDETTLVDAEMNEEDELDLPVCRVSREVRRSEGEVIRSSNSKHVPSSPTAPSAMLTDIQAHTVHSGGRMVNVHTDAVLVPATPQDPFIGQKAERTNGFLDRLRRKNVDIGKTEDVALANENVKKLIGGPESEAVDPDITLVKAEQPRHQPKRRRRAVPVSSDTGSTSSSPQTSQSSRGSDPESAARKRWRDALKPHQKDTLDILYEISHVCLHKGQRHKRSLIETQELVGHLIDKETACNDVVDDYQRRGTRFVENLRNDLKREVSEYETAAADRRSKELDRLRKLNAQVTKNLQRKPVAEELARQFEENQRSWKARWEEAMLACKEMAR